MRCRRRGVGAAIAAVAAVGLCLLPVASSVQAPLNNVVQESVSPQTQEEFVFEPPARIPSQPSDIPTADLAALAPAPVGAATTKPPLDPQAIVSKLATGLHGKKVVSLEIPASDGVQGLPLSDVQLTLDPSELRAQAPQTATEGVVAADDVAEARTGKLASYEMSVSPDPPTSVEHSSADVPKVAQEETPPATVPKPPHQKPLGARIDADDIMTHRAREVNAGAFSENEATPLVENAAPKAAPAEKRAGGASKGMPKLIGAGARQNEAAGAQGTTEPRTQSETQESASSWSKRSRTPPPLGEPVVALGEQHHEALVHWLLLYEKGELNFDSEPYTILHLDTHADFGPPTGHVNKARPREAMFHSTVASFITEAARLGITDDVVFLAPPWETQCRQTFIHPNLDMVIGRNTDGKVLFSKKPGSAIGKPEFKALLDGHVVPWSERHDLVGPRWLRLRTVPAEDAVNFLESGGLFEGKENRSQFLLDIDFDSLSVSGPSAVMLQQRGFTSELLDTLHRLFWDFSDDLVEALRNPGPPLSETAADASSSRKHGPSEEDLDRETREGLKHAGLLAKQVIARTLKTDVGHKEIVEGTTLLVRESAAVLYESVTSWTELGVIHAGDAVVASGPPVETDGYTMVSLKPQGAVDLRALHVQEPLGELLAGLEPIMVAFRDCPGAGCEAGARAAISSAVDALLPHTGTRENWVAEVAQLLTDFLWQPYQVSSSSEVKSLLGVYKRILESLPEVPSAVTLARSPFFSPRETVRQQECGFLEVLRTIWPHSPPLRMGTHVDVWHHQCDEAREDVKQWSVKLVGNFGGSAETAQLWDDNSPERFDSLFGHLLPSSQSASEQDSAARAAALVEEESDSDEDEELEYMYSTRVVAEFRNSGPKGGRVSITYQDSDIDADESDTEKQRGSIQMEELDDGWEDLYGGRQVVKDNDEIVVRLLAGQTKLVQTYHGHIWTARCSEKVPTNEERVWRVDAAQGSRQVFDVEFWQCAKPPKEL